MITQLVVWRRGAKKEGSDRSIDRRDAEHAEKSQRRPPGTERIEREEHKQARERPVQANCKSDEVIEAVLVQVNLNCLCLAAS